MSKHAPGPWTLDDDTASPLVYSAAAGEYVAQVFAYGDGQTGILRKTVQADALLINASPDMLEALQSLVRAVEQFTSAVALGWPELEQAKEAITKATGEHA